jgi:tetratricopeptide (TPR) repeat protein
VAGFLSPLTHEEKVAVSNALPEMYERVIADKRRGMASTSTVNLSSNKLDVHALLWKLDFPDLERLAEALKAGMRAEAVAAQDCDEAIRLFQQALALNPFCDMAAMGCGVCLFQQGKGREAVEWIERAIRLNPHNTQARSNLRKAKG